MAGGGKRKDASTTHFPRLFVQSSKSLWVFILRGTRKHETVHRVWVKPGEAVFTKRYRARTCSGHRDR